MTILVTGGAGFIGSNFVLDWLQTSDEPVVNLDKLTYAGNAANLSSLQNDSRHRFVHGDIGDYDLVLGLLRQHRVRAVINFAAESHVDRSIHGPEDFIQTNIVGCFRLLEAVRAYWQSADSTTAPQDFRLLHVSTDEVYGALRIDQAPFAEDRGYQPNTPYAASKAASDHLLRAYHQTYGVPAIISHCCNNYGPLQFPEKLIPLCIQHALNDLPLPIYGDGEQIRDWLHVGDHCAALRCILANGQAGEVYNVGAGCEKTNNAVVESLCEILDQLKPRADGRSYRQQIRYIRDRVVHDRRYAINAEKLQRQLGWQPHQSFESGLRDTVAWYLNHQDWLNQVVSGDHQAWLRQHYGDQIACDNAFR